MITVSVAKDFTRYPAGRYKRNGETSGEAFRERFLEGPLRNGESILIDFDGTVGYGSSFLEEAFGGVVRALKLSSDYVKEHLTFKSADPSICEEILEYIEDAGRKLG